ATVAVALALPLLLSRFQRPVHRVVEIHLDVALDADLAAEAIDGHALPEHHLLMTPALLHAEAAYGAEAVHFGRVAAEIAEVEGLLHRHVGLLEEHAVEVPAPDDRARAV